MHDFIPLAVAQKTCCISAACGFKQRHFRGTLERNQLSRVTKSPINAGLYEPKNP